MCPKHLKNEHLVVHRFVALIRRGYSIRGYARQGLIETPRLFVRHEELVAEMNARGMTHVTPMLPIYDPWRLGTTTDEPFDCDDCEAWKEGAT